MVDRGKAATAPRARKPACALRERKSRSVEIFRTTPTDTVCPNFYVMAHANGCAFDPLCSYCYLKASFWSLKRPEAFTNTEDMLAEVRAWISRDGLESHVLNTGNLSDSLVFESDRPLLPALVEAFREAERAGRPHALLLVTKGGARHCAPLLGLAPCANVIVSFSLNVPEAAQIHERGAASPEDRLAAVRALKRAGWRLRLRLDPMIAGHDYTGLAGEVRRLRPERVTLGTLRAERGLKKVIRGGLFSLLEKPAAPKGLWRYPWDLRLGMYRTVLSRLRGVPAGLCEETPDMWRAAGLDPDDAVCNCGG